MQAARATSSLLMKREGRTHCGVVSKGYLLIGWKRMNRFPPLLLISLGSYPNQPWCTQTHQDKALRWRGNSYSCFDRSQNHLIYPLPLNAALGLFPSSVAENGSHVLRQNEEVLSGSVQCRIGEVKSAWKERAASWFEALNREFPLLTSKEGGL